MNKLSLDKSVVIEIAGIRIVVILLQLLFLKIYTNYTSLYELGMFYFLFTISYSLNAFLLVPLDYFQQSQLYKLKETGTSLRSFYQINYWILKLTAALLLVSIITFFFINPATCYTVILITLLALSTYAVNLIRGFINNLEKRRQAIYCLLVESVFKILFFLLIIKIYKPSALAILLALLAASMVAFCLLFFLVRKTPEYNYKQLRSYTPLEVVHFAYPISIGAVINWIQLQGYRMILVPLGLVEVVGIYATVANVGTSGMNAYSTVFSQIFVPNLYKSAGRYLKTYLRNAFFSICFILIGGYLLSGIIVKILTKPDFIKYSSLIIYGIIAEGGNFLIGALTIYLTIHNLTKTTIKASIVGLFCFFLCFYSLYLFHSVTVYTIGLPIIVTQGVIVLYLLLIVYKIIKNERLQNE